MKPIDIRFTKDETALDRRIAAKMFNRAAGGNKCDVLIAAKTIRRRSKLGPGSNGCDNVTGPPELKCLKRGTDPER